MLLYINVYYLLNINCKMTLTSLSFTWLPISCKQRILSVTFFSNLYASSMTWTALFQFAAFGWWLGEEVHCYVHRNFFRATTLEKVTLCPFAMRRSNCTAPIPPRHHRGHHFFWFAPVFLSLISTLSRPNLHYIIFYIQLRDPHPSQAPINKNFTYLIMDYVGLAFVYHNIFGRNTMQNLYYLF